MTRALVVAAVLLGAAGYVGLVLGHRPLVAAGVLGCALTWGIWGFVTTPDPHITAAGPEYDDDDQADWTDLRPVWPNEAGAIE